jgi:hypothetical protein
MGEHDRHKNNEAECIQKRACELWEKGGHKQGCDFDRWLIAKKAEINK